MAPAAVASPREALDIIRRSADAAAIEGSTSSAAGPCLFYLHGPEGGATDTATLIRIPPEGGRPQLHHMDIPEPFQGHWLMSSFDNSRHIIVAAEGRAQIVDPFSDPLRWTTLVRLPNCFMHGTIEKMVTDSEFTGAMAIAGFYRRLIYMTRHDDGWIELTQDRRSFTDLIFSRQHGNLFYALTLRADKVISLGFKENVVDIEDMTLDLPPGYVPDYSKPYDDRGRCYHGARLIDAPSGIFIVRWRMLLTRNAQDQNNKDKARQIDVHRLSLPKRTWELVGSLDGCSFFIGANQSIAVSTADFPHLRSNRIYLPHDGSFPLHCDDFSDDEDEKKVEPNLIYDLKAGTWERWGCGIDTRPWGAVWMIPPHDDLGKGQHPHSSTSQAFKRKHMEFIGK